MDSGPPPGLPARAATRLVAAGALALLASACAARHAPNDPPRPDASGWASPMHRDHPLVGKIWDVRAGAFVGDAELRAAAARARFVLVGETHDNPDHHLGQARLVRAVAEARRRPALAFEMIDVDRQPQVDAALAAAPQDALALARAVGWEKSGWPRFGMYRPIFEAGLAAGLPIVAGSLPRTQTRALFRGGTDALPEGVRTRLARVGAFPPDVLRALKAEMAASHCGELPDSMVAPMVSIQKAKDAQLAERLASSDRGDGAILVAGRGHVRADVGVPVFLRGDAAAGEVLTVAFVEVSPGATRPEDYRAEYGGAPLPFDYVAFTPGVEREDPCVGLREHREKGSGEREEDGRKPEGTSL